MRLPRPAAGRPAPARGDAVRRAAVPAPGGPRHRPGQQDPRLRAAGPRPRHGRGQPCPGLPRRRARLQRGGPHAGLARREVGQADDQQPAQDRRPPGPGHPRHRAPAAGHPGQPVRPASTCARRPTSRATSSTSGRSSRPTNRSSGPRGCGPSSAAARSRSMPPSEPVVLITGAAGPGGSWRPRSASPAAAPAWRWRGATPTGCAEIGASLGVGRDRWVAAVGDLREADGAQAVVSAATERFGRIDVLLHLVGGWTGGTPLADLDPAVLRGMLDQHLWTTLQRGATRRARHGRTRLGPHRRRLVPLRRRPGRRHGRLRRGQGGRGGPPWHARPRGGRHRRDRQRASSCGPSTRSTSASGSPARATPATPRPRSWPTSWPTSRPTARRRSTGRASRCSAAADSGHLQGPPRR